MTDVKTTSEQLGGAKNNGAKFKDELLYCENCGISFLWSIEEQKSSVGGTEPSVQAPSHCPACRLLLPIAQRERGMVKWFNPRKHFGFIVRRNAEEIFAPAAEVKGRVHLKEGDLVEFTLGANERGPMAREIRILGGVKSGE